MKPRVKNLLVILGTVLGLALGNYVYNNVQPWGAWGGIIIIIVVLIFSINYFIKQLKNL